MGQGLFSRLLDKKISLLSIYSASTIYWEQSQVQIFPTN